MKKPSFTNRKQASLHYTFASFEISTNLNKKVIFNIMVALCYMDDKRVVFSFCYYY